MLPVVMQAMGPGLQSIADRYGIDLDKQVLHIYSTTIYKEITKEQNLFDFRVAVFKKRMFFESKSHNSETFKL